MGAGRNHIHIINMKFERELSKPLYAVTVNKGLWVSLSHPIYDFLNRKNFSCFVINEHHAYQHRIVTNCINNILRSNMMRIWILRYISYLPSARFQIRTSFQNGIVLNGSCYNMLSPTTGAGRTLHRNIIAFRAARSKVDIAGSRRYHFSNLVSRNAKFRVRRGTDSVKRRRIAKLAAHYFYGAICNLCIHTCCCTVVKIYHSVPPLGNLRQRPASIWQAVFGKLMRA